MAQNGGTKVRMGRLACFWTALVDCAATLPEVPAVSVPINKFTNCLGGTSGLNGEVRSLCSRVKINRAFTLVNMHECMQLRNRMGIEHCFVEDPMLTGMLAARSIGPSSQDMSRRPSSLGPEGGSTAMPGTPIHDLISRRPSTVYPWSCIGACP